MMMRKKVMKMKKVVMMQMRIEIITGVLEEVEEEKEKIIVFICSVLRFQSSHFHISNDLKMNLILFDLIDFLILKSNKRI